MPKDPYAILRALVRAEALRNSPKPPRATLPSTPKPAPEQQAPPGDHERG
ncbi:hypothetical protein AB0D14_12940 [Streptomyces sp. NPDC048484]